MPFTSDPQTVADLLPPPALDDVRAFLLSYLAVPQNLVDDWESGGALRTMWEMEAAILQDLCGPTLVEMAANAYPDTAAGESLTRLAHGWFDVDRVTPGAAVQNATLFCAAGLGPYSSAQVAALVALSSDGARYGVTTPAAITSGGTASVVFTAESPGRAAGLLAVLLAGLPGVSIQAVTIASFGSDGDGDAAVKAGIDARFDDLDVVDEEDRTIAWALAAAPPPLITRFRLDADGSFPGGVLMTLANAGGPVAGGTITAVQAALDNYSPITDSNVAQNSSTHTIDASGVVRIKGPLAARAKAQADAAWTAAMQSATIGAKFFLQTLREIVGDAIKSDPGSNFTAAALSGSDPDGNVTLSSTEVPVAGGTLTAQLTWELV